MFIRYIKIYLIRHIKKTFLIIRFVQNLINKKSRLIFYYKYLNIFRYN